MVKKYLIAILPIFILGCGVNSVPEESDIKKSLVDSFGGCEFVKFSDIKKLNGLKIDETHYRVKQSFKFEITPIKEFIPDAQSYIKKTDAKKIIDDTYNKKNIEIHREYDRLRDEVSKKETMQKDELYQKSVNKQISEQESELQAQSIINSTKSSMNKIHDEFNEKIKMLNDEIESEYIKNSIDKTGVEDQKLIAKVRKGYDDKCQNISKSGKVIIFNSTGLDSGTQMNVFANGVVKSIEEDVVYTKTEKGWLR